MEKQVVYYIYTTVIYLAQKCHTSIKASQACTEEPQNSPYSEKTSVKTLTIQKTVKIVTRLRNLVMFFNLFWQLTV